MNPQSPKQRRTYAEHRDEREAFLLEHEWCMVCGRYTKLEDRTVDEITPGARRMKGFVRRECWLMSCSHCNTHTTPGMELARRLAYKLRGDPWWYSLDAIREVRNNGRNPRVVEQEDVRREAVKLGFLKSEEQ